MSCLIAAPCSGSGKTLLSLTLAAVARARGESLQPFKVGPDYLDPQLLGAVAGRPCRNLDTLLCGEEWVRRSYRWHGGRAERVLVEGVMGLFDGRGSGSEGSSAAVADLLGLPVVLVVEASRQAGSLAALVRGFRDHGPPRVALAGVVLNRVGSDRHHRLLAEALEAIEVPLLGVLPSHPSLELPSRHLGLLTPGELGDLGERQRIWARLAEEHLDLSRLWPLLAPPAGRPEQLDPIRWCLEQTPPAPPTASGPLPVAIATDAAFHFRYPEAQELLAACGLRPVPWSPLADEPLPENCRALLLPGGYPELHAAQLATSRRSLGSLSAAARAGLPIVAECGGLLLLGRELEDADGIAHPMAGLLPFSARRGVLSLGYRQALPGADGLLVRRGEALCGHEFHRWQLLPQPPIGDELSGGEGLWQLDGWGTPARSEGWTAPNVHASWLHLHWAGCPAIPSRLARAAASAVPLPMNAVSFSPLSG
ncbi:MULTISPECIES: cobyrinate a,c-diamide synthase [unclassified Cyanobium]|uniref:cobyrinate a,c-diamide synthase n=1 Tax=unclassified Cyanobium TaxID=2627006 RepID=UPI0020CEE12B|nr:MULTISPECIES: cobyrinate a,c-diamide synthase [unclassified Cyanobium]MCP9832720.1 cobyrinate a,c-diamide synthase [Cyanobium sp. La Preciosa 7G6]MCP9935471.1 cobyrinate a,c-diamide synthase [Cyanobium sp. Aljojuca 7A6]